MGTPAIDGAGVHLIRVLGPNDMRRFDPFLILDVFDSRNPKDYVKGFPFHPHRGLETVTYLLKGRIEHEDSVGNKGTIHKGECMWMTAGSGVIHQEMPQPSEHYQSLQLWVNLAKEDKMTAPAYFEIVPGMMNRVVEPFGTVKVITGQYNGHKGAKAPNTDVTLMDIEIKPDESLSMPVDEQANIFVYIVDGSGRFGGDKRKLMENKVALRFGKGDEFYVRAGSEGLRFIFFAAHPLNEPISWGGPIVMNSREELEQAFDDLDTGRFVKL